MRFFICRKVVLAFLANTGYMPKMTFANYGMNENAEFIENINTKQVLLLSI